MKLVNYLEITFNLNDGTYKPYTKLNNEIIYLHKDINQPPVVTNCDNPTNPSIYRIKVIHPIL